MPPLFIRADASTEIGTGHVMRMLALAQAWQDMQLKKEETEAHEGREEEKVVFICALLPEFMEERLEGEGCSVHRINAIPGSSDDLNQTLTIAKHLTNNEQPITNNQWLALDGYAFDRTYQQAFRAAGFKLLIVDDYNHLPEYECDILLNQNLGAEEYDYTVNANAKRLMGSKYALLRREFRKAACPPKSSEWGRSREVGSRRSEVGVPSETDVQMESGRPEFASFITKNQKSGTKHILITMGGADPQNATLKVIEALNGAGLQDVHVKALVGAANPHRELLAASAAACPSRCELLTDVEDMPALMQWADLAITAAGSTCWELMCMGVPMLVMVLAENQERIAEQLQREKCAVNLGWHNEWSKESFWGNLKRALDDLDERNRIRAVGCHHVNCHGATCVCEAMLENILTLRPACEADDRLLWEWANHPSVRAASFRSDKIPWAEHEKWYSSKLREASCRIYIAETTEPVGVVRVESAGGAIPVVSVALSTQSRGKGLGVQLIAAGSERAALDLGVDKIYAYIKLGNVASCRAFERAGYTLESQTSVLDQAAMKWVWMRQPSAIAHIT